MIKEKLLKTIENVVYNDYKELFKIAYSLDCYTCPIRDKCSRHSFEECIKALRSFYKEETGEAQTEDSLFNDLEAVIHDESELQRYVERIISCDSCPHFDNCHINSENSDCTTELKKFYSKRKSEKDLTKSKTIINTLADGCTVLLKNIPIGECFMVDYNGDVYMFCGRDSADSMFSIVDLTTGRITKHSGELKVKPVVVQITILGKKGNLKNEENL